MLHKTIAYMLCASTAIAATFVLFLRPFDKLPSAPIACASVSEAVVMPKLPQKHVYFTIDDGPTQFSDEILAMAERRGVPMTVFLVGEHMWGKEYPAHVEAYRNSDCMELGNHSFCHANNNYDLWYLNPVEVLRDFQKNTKLLGLNNGLARLPGNSMWELGKQQKCVNERVRSSGELLGQHGYQVFGWDVEWHFYPKSGLPRESAEKIMAKITKCEQEGGVFTPNHVVVLLHERHFQQANEVEKLIEMLQKKGYVFSFLKDYPIKEQRLAQ